MIRDLPRHIFDDLSNLKTLWLQDNKIADIRVEVFPNLKSLVSLNLENNCINFAEKGAFETHPNLSILSESVFLCCVARRVKSCKPQPEELSSCDDLLAEVYLRVALCLIGILSIGLNTMVFFTRLQKTKESKVYSFFVGNLAASDFLTGFYLLIIASADQYYRDRYFMNDANWKVSPVCKLAGSIATVGAEVSVFILTLISYDRLVVVVYPFRRSLRFRMTTARITTAVMWLAAIAMATIPLIGIDYFRGYYGRSTVCLPLPLTADRPNGWEFSLAVFSVFNLLSFAWIAIVHSIMLVSVCRSRSKTTNKQMSVDRSLTLRILFIVLTDMCCWVPLGTIGFLAVGGVQIPKMIYVYTAVFVLPINSALNPLLYTFCTRPYLDLLKKRLARIRVKPMDGKESNTGLKLETRL